MIIIEMMDIEKSFGEKLLLKFPKLVISKNDRVGLIGMNGSGKSTLLKIIFGEMEVDSGTIKRYGKISYFKQFGDFNHEAKGKFLRELGVQNERDNAFASGGEKTRLRLAEVFSKSGHLLLLDEPTSNLDLNGIRLLKDKLKNIESFILISHDVELLNEVCNRIIDIRNNTIYDYPGNFNAYEKQKDLESETKEKEYKNYTYEKKRLENAYLYKKQKADKLSKKPKNMSSSEYKTRNYVATSRSSSGKEKSMQKSAKAIKSRLEQLDIKDRPEKQVNLKLNFNLTNPPQNKIIIRAENLSFSYKNKVIFHKASFNIRNGSKTAIIGENGVGKTTLLSLIENSNEFIKIVPKAKIGFLYQEFNNLNKEATVLESVLLNSVQSEIVSKNILARLLFTNCDIKKPVSILSGGEKIRLSLAKLLVSEINILVLDEPTNYLDVPSIKILEKVLKSYEGTVIFVSHDKSFINKVATNIIEISNNTIREFEGNLSEYEHYQKQEKNNFRAEKTLLELKRMEIINKLTHATEEEKLELEKEYFCIVRELKKIET